MPKRTSFYQLMLSFYPEHYREQYGMQAAQTLDDMLADTSSRGKRALIWARELLVLPGNAAEQHLIELSRRGHLRPRTLVDMIALALLLPFVLAIVIDEFSEYFSSSHLYGSWLWSLPVLLIWALVLPLFSLAISSIALILSLLRSRQRQVKSPHHLQIPWQTIVVGVLALGLLSLTVFHDSVQCWTTNPGNAIANISQTSQCTSQTMLRIDFH